jgi:hypothetical protein
MLKLSLALSIALAGAVPAFADPSWFMVRTLDGHTGVMGTYPSEDACRTALDALKSAYAAGSGARVAGKPFGERSCANEWPN